MFTQAEETVFYFIILFFLLVSLLIHTYGSTYYFSPILLFVYFCVCCFLHWRRGSTSPPFFFPFFLPFFSLPRAFTGVCFRYHFSASCSRRSIDIPLIMILLSDVALGHWPCSLETFPALFFILLYYSLVYAYSMKEKTLLFQLYEEFGPPLI